MKGYEITLEANSFDGSQVFACYAIDEQDAMMKLKRGECEIIESNIEVLNLDKVPIDIMESDDISSRLLSDINVKQQELIAKQAEQIKMLREALIGADDLMSAWLSVYENSNLNNVIGRTLSATEQK